MNMETIEEKTRYIETMVQNMIRRTRAGSGRRRMVVEMVEQELDMLITTLEQFYYQAIIKRRRLRRTYSNMEDTIKESQEMMNAFMPYMLAYSVLQHSASTGSAETEVMG